MAGIPYVLIGIRKDGNIDSSKQIMAKSEYKCHKSDPLDEPNIPPPAAPPSKSPLLANTEYESGSSWSKICKFGSQCYRTNSEHLRDFIHPKTRTLFCNKCKKYTERATMHANNGYEKPWWLCLQCR